MKPARIGRLSAWLAAGLLGLFGPSAAQAQPKPPLVLGTLEDRVVAAPVEAVLTEAYRRAGSSVRFEPMPLRRAAALLQAGQIDGDLARTQPYFDAYPQLLRVGVPLRNQTFWVHALPPCTPERGMAELKLSLTAYQRGAQAVEAWLPEQARLPTESLGAALQALLDGKAQHSVLALSPSALSAVTEQYPELCRMRLPLLSLDLFHALASQHVKLRAPLEQALAGMQRDGSLDRTWKAHEASMRQLRVRAPKRR